MEVTRSNKFIKIYKKLDKFTIIKISKILQKIINNPKMGKPMRYIRKGTREVYIKPFRLSYIYTKKSKTIKLLDLYHKDEQ